MGWGRKNSNSTKSRAGNSNSDNNEDEAVVSPPNTTTTTTNNGTTTTAAAANNYYHSFADTNNDENENNASNNVDPLAIMAETRAEINTQYRGFSTSISDMFSDVSQERIDCCSITCCGILQNDRDRYLLLGIKPPSAAKRLLMHVLLPTTIFFVAGMCAMKITNVQMNQLISTTLILCLLAYFYIQLHKGRRKRMNIRKDLLFTKYHQEQANRNSSSSPREQYNRLAQVAMLDHGRDDESWNSNDNDEVSARAYLLGQTKHDIRCAHPCCLVSCYAEDRPPSSRQQPHDDETICRCLYDTVCPGFAGIHIQCCGLCAIAQEARDVETCVLPPPYRRLDYITMEKYLKYYPAIYNHRHDNSTSSSSSTSNVQNLPIVDEETPDDENDNNNTSSNNAMAVVVSSSPPRSPTTNTSSNKTGGSSATGTLFGHPLSLMSYRLVQSVVIVWFVLLLWSVVGPLYWRKVLGRHGSQQAFNVPDFILLLLTFGQAFMYVALFRLVIRRYNNNTKVELSMDAMIKYFASGFFLSASLALFWELTAALLVDTFVSLILAIAGIDIQVSPEKDGTSSSSSASTSVPSRKLLTDLGSSIVETLRVGGEPDYTKVFGLDHPVFYTLYLLVASFVVAAFIEEVCKYFGYRMVEHPDFLSQNELEEALVVMQNQSRRRNNDIGEDDDDETGGEDAADHLQTLSRMDFSKQGQSVQNRGAAITLAMICTAIGFACCENLMYIKTAAMELGVLIQRTFFPVHPILAAIQSIGVCRRELEGHRGSQLGRIILPAVLFHGSFDFWIVFISFVGQLAGQRYEEGDLKVTNTAEFLSILSCVTIMAISLVYLQRESKKQRDALAAIDEQATVDRSRLI